MPANRKQPMEGMTNPLKSRADVISEVLRHCPEHDFLFLAGVSKAWKAAWLAIDGSKKSSLRLTLASQARIRWVFLDPDFRLMALRMGEPLCLAAWAGNMVGLRATADDLGPKWFKTSSARGVTRMAAAGGSLEALRWGRAQGCPWDADTVRAAAMGGHLEVLRWATQEGCPWDKDEDMAQPGAGTWGGRWAALLLIMEQRHRPWNPSYEGTCACAASGGHLEVLEWARTQGCGWNERTCALAARHGHLSVLKWARARGCPWDEATCSLAARGGHLGALAWAVENGCPWNETTCSYAAEGGHLDVLQWARARGCPWDETTCTRAARRGHMKVLLWARAQGCAWDEGTCSNAAAGGYLEVLQWARDRGCPWDASTCSGAAEGGHLGVLQWVRAQGCPWEETTCMKAAMHGRLTVLQWARRHGCPIDLDECAVMAKRYHNPEVSAWIKANNKFDHVWFFIRCALMALFVALWCGYYPKAWQ